MNKHISAEELQECRQEALSNWDFEAYSAGNGEKCRKALENMKIPAEGIDLPDGWDIWDWLDEYATATAADM